MRERKELQELVVCFIQDSCYTPTASDIYSNLSENNPGLMYKEGIFSVRSLAKTMQSFDNIERGGEKGSPRIYKLRQ